MVKDSPAPTGAQDGAVSVPSAAQTAPARNGSTRPTPVPADDHRDPMRTVLDALRAGKGGVTEKRGGGFRALCPHHDDHEPSLDIDPGRDGVLLKCRANCTIEAVLAAAGLEKKDLFPGPGSGRGTMRGPARRNPRNSKPGESSPQRKKARGRGTVTEYPIRDEDGELHAIHVRTDYPDRPKKFQWKRGNGEWGLGGLKTADLPYYGSERLAAAKAAARDGEPVEVVVTEGEKAAKALNDRGILAVASVTGSGGCPSPARQEILRGCIVKLFRDNAPDGHEHMVRIAEALRGIAAAVLWVDWPEAGPKDDAADWTGTTAELEALIDAAGEVPPPSLGEDVEVEPASTSRRRLFNPIELRERIGSFHFLVDHLLPASGIAFLVADPGVGKSTAAVSLALHVVAGRSKWLGRDLRRGGRAVYISGEGTVGLCARIIAGAEAYGIPDDVLLERFRVSSCSGALTDPEDVDRWLAEIGPEPVALIIIDTLAANLGGADENSSQDASTFVAALKRIGDLTGALVLVLHHSPQDLVLKGRGRGSSVFRGAADADLLMVKGKNGLSIRVPKPKDFQAKPMHVEIDEHPITGSDDTAAVLIGADGPDEPDESAEDKTRSEAQSRRSAQRVKDRDDLERAAALLAEVMAKKPGLPISRLRAEVRARRPVSQSRFNVALALLGDAVFQAPGPRGAVLHYVDGREVPTMILERVQADDRDRVSDSRPPDENPSADPSDD